MKAIKLIIFTLMIINLTLTARPDKKDRRFVSDVVDKHIEDMKSKLKDPELAKIYESCMPNTLDTTVEFDPTLKEETFVITGDIEAMWQRDSTFQLLPYIKFLKQDTKLKGMVQSLIRRQMSNMIEDPYANAFNKHDMDSPWISDHTTKIVNGQVVPAMTQKLWERKYELDSVIGPFYLSTEFYDITGDSSFIDDNFVKAIGVALDLVKKQMRGSAEEDTNGGPEYFFQRQAFEAFDTLHQGRGNPVNSCGLIKSMFRSSDDSALFAYNIAENAFLVTTFSKLSGILTKISKSTGFIKNKGSFVKEEIKILADDLKKISERVRESIYKEGIIVDHVTNEKYFAYEVDCYGNKYFIDDPGYPSLLSLPYFEFLDIKDPVYQNTRKRIFTNRNAFYFKGKLGDGIGSPHTERNYIWPLATIMRGLTATDEKELIECIELLKKSALTTDFMHESFHVDDAEKYTRSWFAWSNGFFGILMDHVAEKYPHLVLKK